MESNDSLRLAGPSANVPTQRRLRNAASVLCWSVLAFGLCVMLGWWFHVPFLKGFNPGGITAKGNTGLCFVLLSLALWVNCRVYSRPLWNRIGAAACLLVCATGVISLTEYFTGWNSGLDDLLFRPGPEDSVGSIRPALMAAITALSFIFLGLSVWLINSRRLILLWCSQGLFCAAFVVAMFGVLDPVLDPRTTHTHISPLTPIMLVTFSLAILFSRPELGLGALIASSTSGGTLARRVLPAAVLVPIAVGYLRWHATRAGIFSEWLGVSLMIMTVLVLLAIVILWTASMLDGAEQRRLREQENSARLASIVNSSNEAIIGKTLGGTVVSWNPAAEAMYGYTAEEMLGRSIATVVPPNRMQEFEEVLGRVKKGEQVRHFESERIRKNGQRFPVSIGVAPIRDASGDLVGASTVARDITQEKEAEQKLRRQTALLDLAHDAIFVRDMQSRVVYWNAGAEKTYGYSSQAALGKVTHQLLRTEFPMSLETIESLIRENKQWDGELFHYTRDGARISVTSRWSLMCDDRGAPVSILEINRDITERKLAEAALRSEREKFNTILDAVPPYVCLLTPDYHLAFANREFKQRFGEAPGLRCYEALFNRTEPCEICETYKVLKDGQSRRWEWTGPDGRNYDVYDLPFTDTDGSKLILEMGIDITERKRAEAAVKAERRRFEAILNGLPAMVCLLTPNYEVRFANHAFRKQFGEPQGRKCHDYCFGQSAPCTFCESFEVLKTGKPHDWEVMTKDARCIHAFDFPFTDVDGSPLVLEMDLDITEQRQAEEKIRTLNRELEERVLNRTSELQAANKELEAFSYSVSHDLRAPLRHISGFSKILSEEFGPQLPEEAQRHLQRIQDGTRRMGQLIDDLLNLSRVGRRELQRQVTSLGNVVRQVLSDLQPECEGREVQWNISPLPFADCDGALLKQVFQNLLSNALKFTRPRNQAVIEVGCKEEDGVPVIFIRDNGVGFNMKYASKLFGVFQRMHRAEDFEGTGVGLATVQRIVQKHGGRVWAEAELDKGATFYFTLAPLDKTHQESAPQEEVAHALAGN